MRSHKVALRLFLKLINPSYHKLILAYVIYHLLLTCYSTYSCDFNNIFPFLALITNTVVIVFLKIHTFFLLFFIMIFNTKILISYSWVSDIKPIFLFHVFCLFCRYQFPSFNL